MVDRVPDEKYTDDPVFGYQLVYDGIDHSPLGEPSPTLSICPRFGAIGLMSQIGPECT